MPKVTEEHLEARKQQILHAASTCFANRGFHQTTMHDICAESGMSPGSVYRYFKSKEELITHIAKQNQERQIALIEDAKLCGTARESIEELMKMFFNKLDNHDKCPMKLDVELWGEAVRNERIMDILHSSFAGTQGAFMEIVKQAQEQGELDVGLDPKTVTQAISSLFLGMHLQTCLKLAEDKDEYLKVVNKMFDGLFTKSEKK